MMIIVIPTHNYPPDRDGPFTVTEAIYKSVCGSYVVKVDDPAGLQVEPSKTIDGIKFKWWKYKNWMGEWELIK